MDIKRNIRNKRSAFVSQKNSQPIKNSSYISGLFTRTLISVIFVLLCAIFVNMSDKNLLLFKDYFFNNTLEFTKINELYKTYFGNIIPEEISPTISVASTDKDYINIEEMSDSYKITLTGDTMHFLQSGIVVFIGDKENLGKTVIIQGNDGVDIWYSNLNNVNLSMYDYVEKNTLVGEFKENVAILTFMEDGNYISYENYLS